MKYVLTNSSSTLHIDFVVDGELVVPVSPTITLTDNTGAALSGFDGATISLGDPTDSFANISIVNTANVKTLVFEFRTAKIDFTFNSTPYTIYLKYGLADRLDIPVTPDEVRTVIGLSDDEWSDDQMDIQLAYISVDADLANSASDIIDAGSTLLRSLIEAIKLRTVIDILPAIELMALQATAADNTSANRFSNIDFEALRANINARYAKALLVVDASDGEIPTMAVLGLGTDALTGN